MYLETPKGRTDSAELDVMNLATLRKLTPPGPEGG
jgi:hypothetical protein